LSGGGAFWSRGIGTSCGGMVFSGGFWPESDVVSALGGIGAF
jgi:hypothetical protein